jgi:hypothetical protein
MEIEMKHTHTSQIRTPVGGLLDIQLRFSVDRLRLSNLHAPTLNAVLDIYAKCPNALLKEIHFIRCETEHTDANIFAAMLNTQQNRCGFICFS